MPSVSAIGLCRPEYFIRISYGTQSEVISSPDQQFYCVNKDEWMKADELCIGDQLATADGNSVTIEAIEIVPASGPTIIVSVEPDHVFSYTPGKLLTHNVVVVIPIVTYVFGEGAVWFGGATAATILVAVAKYVVYTIAEKMGCDVHDTSVTIADHSYVPESATPHHAGVISAHSSSPHAVSPFDIPQYEASFSAPVTIEQNRSANRAPQSHSYQPESDIAAYLKTQPRPVQVSAPCGEPDMPAWIPPQFPVTTGIPEDQPVWTCGTGALALPKEPRACGSSVDNVTWDRLQKKGRNTLFQDAVERGKEALNKQLRGCRFAQQSLRFSSLPEIDNLVIDDFCEKIALFCKAAIGPKCRYAGKDAAYHHPNSEGGTGKGAKSRSGVDSEEEGQKLLENSYPVSPEEPQSKRRIAIIGKDRFIVFDQTSSTPSCKYHSHERTWKQLEQDMKDALKETGLVNPKNGKLKSAT